MNIDKKTLRAIKKECREMAHEMTKEHYRLYDEIWTDRIKIDSALYDHGKDTVREINQLMPNLLTYNPAISPLDIVAERYGFGVRKARQSFGEGDCFQCRTVHKRAVVYYF